MSSERLEEIQWNFQKRCLLRLKVLKVKEKQGFTLSLEDKFFDKTTTGGQIDHSPPAVLGLRNPIEIYAPDLFF